LTLGIGLSPAVGSAQAQDIAGREASGSRCAEELSSATLLGMEDAGGPSAYRKGDRFLLKLSLERFGRLILWHAEAIEMPTQSNGDNEIGTTVVSLERQGGWILVRDRSPGFQKRAGRSSTQSDDTGSEPRPADAGADPIYQAIAGNTSAPIMAVIPVVCDGPYGLVVVDITKLFSNDIETLSAKKQVAFAKMQVKSVGSGPFVHQGSARIPAKLEHQIPAHFPCRQSSERDARTYSSDRWRWPLVCHTPRAAHASASI
jgi:hypothetical protein